MKTELFDFSCFLSNTALVTDQGETLTYGQLQEKADLVKQSLQKGKLAFCLCSNTVASIVGYVSLVQEGVATLLLDAEKDKELIGNLLKIYKPNYVWAPQENDFGKVLVSDGGYVLYRYSESELSIHPDLALLLTTSGSTGSPKLVRLTQKNLAANANAIAEYLHITPSERPVTTLPMYYSFGMSVINSHFIMGATLLLTEKTVLETEFWDFVKSERATSIAGVPYTYEMLKRLRFFRMELPELRTMIQAGGKLNAAIAKEYVEFAKATGKEFIVMYGQTEAAPRMSYLPFKHASDKYASIGVVIPGGKFSLRDENNHEITMPDMDGELIYMGDNVCMGYAETPEDLAKGDDNKGILKTGDIARRDADGFYYITGRMKRFVKVWGNRVNLDALEQLIKPITPDCACVGVDDAISIFVTDERFTNEIKTLLVEKTGLNTRAFTVKVITEIPKIGAGKINYSRLG